MGILNSCPRIGNLGLLGVFPRLSVIGNHDIFHFWNELGNLVRRFLGGSPKVTTKMGSSSAWSISITFFCSSSIS